MFSKASLNHVYRTVWNQSLGAMVAVAEISAGRGRSPGTGASGGTHIMPTPAWGLTAIALGVAVACGATPGFALANPTGGVALVGQATMTSSGNNLLVTTQNGAGATHSTIDWQSFSIPKGNSTYFLQPNAGSTSINRVVTSTPSQLFGTLGSNGNLVLVNQSGITVSAGAVVDTAGFTASALRMSDADALTGRLRFGNASTPGGAVSVQGNVLGRSGDVVLIGSSVSTGVDALVEAPNGAITLVAGHAVSIESRGLDGITFEVQAPTDSAINLGTLKGDAVGIFACTLKHSGLIQATQASMQGGKVVLKAAGDAFLEGAGQILATGTVGGNVDILGNRVGVTDQAVIDVSGERGGGVVRVGGDYQGQNSSIQNASKTFFGPQASIQADATSTGAGGKVIVWADEVTRAYGHISAKGGVLKGDGGFVETSGKQFLDVSGIRVDAGSRAQNAASGVWLLDPPDIEIIAGSTTTANVTGAPNFVDVGTGVSTLSETDLVSALSNGNVSVVATGALTVSTPIVAGSNGNLSLKASSGSLVVNQPITLTNKNLGLESVGGSIFLNAGIDVGAGSGEVKLKAGFTISQSAGTIVASKLEAESGGTVTLSQSNSVNTVAANVTGSGGFTFKSASSIDVNTVGSISGVTTNGGVVSIESAAAILLSSGVNAGSGNVTLTSTGASTTVSQTSTAPITANVLTVTDGGGGISLAQSANNAGTVVLTSSGSSPVSYWDTNAFAVGPISVAGGLTLKSSGGAMTQSGAISTGAFSSLTVESGGGDVTLENASNSLHGLSITSGGIVRVKDGGAVNLYSVAAGSFRLGAVGSVTLASGGVSTSAGAVEISSSTSSISAAEGIQATGGAVTLKAANGLTVNSVSGVTSNVNGDAVVLIADTGTFSGTSQITTPNGRWLAYLKDPGGHTFPGSTSAPAFKQYNAPYGVAVLGSGNGVLYNNTNAAKLTGTLTGSVSKVYDGGLSIGVSGAIPSAIGGGYVDGDSGGTVSLSGAVGNLVDPNVGTAKSVFATSLNASGIAGGNGIGTVYGYQTQFSGGIGQVTPKLVVVSGALIGATSKAYDGTAAANLNPANFQLSGFEGNDGASVTKTTGAYASQTVGTNILVSASLVPADYSPAGATLLSNYSLPTAVSGSIGTITQRPLSTWTGAVSNVWNAPGNWDALPTGVNVAAVSIPAGVTPIIFDSSMGSTTLQSFNSSRPLQVTGGSLQVVNGLTAAGFTQSGGTVTGQFLNSSGPLQMVGGFLQVVNGLTAAGFLQSAGTVSGAGAFKIVGDFNQSGGSVSMGSIDATQSGGNMTVNSLKAATVNLTSGSISETPAGGIEATTLTTSSNGGTVLLGTGNKIGSWSAINGDASPLQLLNKSEPLILAGIRTAGPVSIENTGGISLAAPLNAPKGKVKLVAHSPITIGTDGLFAGGDIELIATNTTSAGNIVINGPVESSAGSVSITAANDLTQNGTVFGALGVYANVGGVLTFTSSAKSGITPVSYAVDGKPVAAPPSTEVSFDQAKDTAGQTNLVTTFLDKFATAVQSQNEEGPEKEKDKARNELVVEGEICRP